MIFGKMWKLECDARIVLMAWGNLTCIYVVKYHGQVGAVREWKFNFQNNSS